MNALSLSQNSEARHSELLGKIQEEVKMFEVSYFLIVIFVE